MLDSLVDPAVHTVVLMTSAQVGKTEMVNNVIAYYAHLDPGPMLCVQPNLDMARSWSSDRIEPMVRDTPALRAIFRAGRGTDGRSSRTHKTFPGGHLTVVGANAPAGLAARPIRILLCDEVDRFPYSAGEEGDPVELATKRQTTFHDRKRVLVSTPTVMGESRIQLAYEGSDKRVFTVPCPECGTYQEMRWEQVRYDRDAVRQTEGLDPTAAAYECEYCPAVWNETRKQEILACGVWSAQAPFGGTAGFHISELYSPWSSWARVAFAYERAQEGAALKKVWWNTSLGLPWDEGGGLDANALQERAEAYAEVPRQVLFISAGVDVQEDRLECLARGWAAGEESWAIEHKVILGDPRKQRVWRELEDWRTEGFLADDGTTRSIDVMCVDSGHLTNEVYTYCRPRWNDKVFATKGRGGPNIPVADTIAKRRKAPTKCRVLTVGVDNAKDWLTATLRQKEMGAGYMHYHDRLTREFFEQLVSEVKRKVLEKGRLTIKWVKLRERNEAWDLEVLCLAGLRLIKPRLVGLVPTKFNPQMRLPGMTHPSSDATTLMPGERLPAEPKKGGWI